MLTTRRAVTGRVDLASLAADYGLDFGVVNVLMQQTHVGAHVTVCHKLLHGQLPKHRERCLKGRGGH